MLEDDTDLYPLFQVMKQKYIPTWHYWIWQFSICNGNNIEVQVIFSVAELSGFTFCYCTQKSAESCLVPISELPGSIQVYVLGGKKLCLIIRIIHHHKPQYSHLFLKAARHPLNKDVLGNKISDTCPQREERLHLNLSVRRFDSWPEAEHDSMVTKITMSWIQDYPWKKCYGSVPLLYLGFHFGAWAKLERSRLCRSDWLCPSVLQARVCEHAVAIWKDCVCVFVLLFV